VKNLLKKYYIYRGVAKLRLNQREISPSFYVSSYLELEKILQKDGESDILNLFLEKVKPGDIIFDVGANIGLYTLPCALKAKEGMVIAFEPVPMWFNRLQDNISLNSIKNVKAYNLGLHRETQKINLTIKKVLGSGMGSIMDDYGNNIPTDVREDVCSQLVNADEFISENKIPLPNLIKIDVEGAELHVLAGLRSAISQRGCRLILCEVHPKFMKGSPVGVESLLQESGYKLETIIQRGSEYHILALKD